MASSAISVKWLSSAIDFLSQHDYDGEEFLKDCYCQWDMRGICEHWDKPVNSIRRTYSFFKQTMESPTNFVDEEPSYIVMHEYNTKCQKTGTLILDCSIFSNFHCKLQWLVIFKSTQVIVILLSIQSASKVMCYSKIPLLWP